MAVRGVDKSVTVMLYCIGKVPVRKKLRKKSPLRKIKTEH